MDSISPRALPGDEGGDGEEGGTTRTSSRDSEATERALRSATLTRLRIAGFKSFAEAQTVEVLPGLTGIVGPNGCGKSNVVEALRWAMGESNARAMRGAGMDDVVFAGTSTRAARSHAEVALWLEDAAGLAPPPNAEVTELEIIRRIERGEGTGYRINGREVRGRDVATMFADLGTGSRASGMVSQGKVAALIGARPEDRRQVLEEAAGIAGLRARRHEAELKLRQAEGNLSRAEDLRAQLERQREGLRRQAKQAARYRNLSGLTREAEAEWLAILAGRGEAELHLARGQRAQAQASLQAAEAEAARAAVAAHTATNALPAPREAEALARTLLERRRVEAEGLSAEESRARAALEAAGARLRQVQEDLERAAMAARAADEALARLGGEEAGLAAEAGAMPARLAAAEAEAGAARAALDEAGRAAERAAEEAAAAAADEAHRRAAREAAEARANRAAGALARLESERGEAEAVIPPPEALPAAETRLAEAEAARAAADAALEQAEAARVTAQEAHAAARLRADSAAAALQRATGDRDAALARLNRARRDSEQLAAEQARIAAARLPEGVLEAAREELAGAEAAHAATTEAAREAETAREAARAALARAREAASEAEAGQALLAAEAQGLEALLRSEAGKGDTPLLDATAVPPGLEVALGAALGEALEAAAGSGAPRHWRELPPLSGSMPLPVGVRGFDGLMEAPASLRRALSQVGLLPDGADGAALQPALAPGQILVSAEGGLWRWDGYTVRAGAPSAAAVRLQRRNRLRALKSDLATAQDRAAGAREARLVAEAAEREAIARENGSREARRAAESRLARARAGESRLSAETAAVAGREAALAPRLEQAAAELDAAQAALSVAEAALAALPDAGEAARTRDAARAAETRAGAAEAGARAARREAGLSLDAARTARDRLAADAARAESRLAALLPEIERALAEQAEAQAALEIAGRAGEVPVETARAALEAARATLAEARGTEARLREAAAALHAEAARIGARREALGAERAGWSDRAAEAGHRLAELERRAEEARRLCREAAEAPEAAGSRREASARILAEAEAAHAGAARKLAEAEQAVRDTAEARHRTEASHAAAREARLAADAAVQRAEDAARALMARIAERLGPEAVLPEAPEDLSEAAEERARRKAERLAREREEMGPVNLRAEGEVAEIEARLAGLDAERDSIATAIHKLRGSVGHLNREARERLRAVFDKVNAEFQALFTRLFGGGRAHLALVGSEDILEAGLELFAEPPGKRLAALSLLSGGEQALTALSLIFAVFRCQPAPVCVLDEVDAPLDDANVERLCGLLDAMAEGGTRFLVVTHHPLTMARMHRLYGVTMQERGVSRLLSVDLSRAVEMVAQATA
ncbi:Chromosome partition protein smc [Roseomonas mucosa]|uniref:Chromosome partition protein Smc n=8 Tax=Roseomonas TaxID=125216 RepID=A0A379MXZ5_9PROT|nr:AAA family ATPase [Roseomonas mucosa]MBS5902959.1 AAA family ATPase [Acetobacteraceae bacterium]MCG7351030.1 AAA family ATPase [Roseomonas mucosa]MCG7356458.1 AAA family ATPase [Roseomonas mucosa]MDT8315340.1 AAA family ATPase [Roseomonas mucosa]QDD96558.1 Chromosome partition protein smc [Roseomonas mucosa]